MTRTHALPIERARRMALAAQGLYGPCEKSALGALRRIGYAQIDTISVVERAHHHTLWTRAPRSRPGDVERLVREKKAFEYWWHAAAYLPIEDFRFSLPRKKAFKAGESHWFAKDKKVMRFVADRIKAEGPLKSSDFESPRRSGPWWGWKPAKRALEQLFQDGTLMIARREGFQKVYDLAERVLPESVSMNAPSHREFAEHLVLKTLDAHGLAEERELTYLRRRETKSAVKKILPELAEEGRIVALRIASLPGVYYARARARAAAPDSAPPRLRLLSPFDNAVIQRRRLKELFGFDYQIECYLPEPKRKFGYFCLPLLWGDRFVGRLDPKADRARGELRVKSLHWEANAPDEAREALPEALSEFAAFNGCRTVRLPRRR